MPALAGNLGLLAKQMESTKWMHSAFATAMLTPTGQARSLF